MVIFTIGVGGPRAIFKNEKGSAAKKGWEPLIYTIGIIAQYKAICAFFLIFENGKPLKFFLLLLLIKVGKLKAQMFEVHSCNQTPLTETSLLTHHRKGKSVE